MKRWLGRLVWTVALIACGLYAAARVDDRLGSGFRSWQQTLSVPSTPGR